MLFHERCGIISRTGPGRGYCSKEDLLNLMEWVRNNPEVPEGAWCKDFGTFKLVVHEAMPSTFLEKHQPCFGTVI